MFANQRLYIQQCELTAFSPEAALQSAIPDADHAERREWLHRGAVSSRLTADGNYTSTISPTQSNRSRCSCAACQPPVPVQNSEKVLRNADRFHSERKNEEAAALRYSDNLTAIGPTSAFFSQPFFPSSNTPAAVRTSTGERYN